MGNLYKWLISCGINQRELFKTFNAGYGMALIADKKNIKKIDNKIKKQGFSSSLLGTINIKKNIREKSVLLRGKLNK